jgi:hypothetical protein
MATGTAMSNKLEEDVLNRWLKNTTTILGAAPATVYVAIGTAGDDTGVTEPSTTRGYTRTSISFGATAAGTNPTTAMQVTGPTAAINVGPNTVSDWGTITHFGIYDAASSGNLLFWGALSSSVAIAVNDTFQFAAGAITIGVD